MDCDSDCDRFGRYSATCGRELVSWSRNSCSAKIIQTVEDQPPRMTQTPCPEGFWGQDLVCSPEAAPQTFRAGGGSHPGISITVDVCPKPAPGTPDPLRNYK